jgi:hypothetical protein
MKQTITKNDKNIKILNSLITNGFYNGYIESEKFELRPNRWPNNHRLVGILNNDGKYDLKFDYTSPMNIAVKFLLAFGILGSVIFLFMGHWILPVIFIVCGLNILVTFKLKEKKEMNYFTDKLVEFQNTRE